MTPFAEGLAERKNGTPFTANPYPLGTSASRQWSKGWRQQIPVDKCVKTRYKGLNNIRSLPMIHSEFFDKRREAVASGEVKGKERP